MHLSLKWTFKFFTGLEINNTNVWKFQTYPKISKKIPKISKKIPKILKFPKISKKFRNSFETVRENFWHGISFLFSVFSLGLQCIIQIIALYYYVLWHYFNKTENAHRKSVIQFYPKPNCLYIRLFLFYSFFLAEQYVTGLQHYNKSKGRFLLVWLFT